MKKGFSLIELVIIIAVIAILAGVSIPTIAGISKNQKRTNALQEIKQKYSEIMLETSVLDGKFENNTIFKNGDYYFKLVSGEFKACSDEEIDSTSSLKQTKFDDIVVYSICGVEIGNEASGFSSADAFFSDDNYKRYVEINFPAQTSLSSNKQVKVIITNDKGREVYNETYDSGDPLSRIYFKMYHLDGELDGNDKTSLISEKQASKHYYYYTISLVDSSDELISNIGSGFFYYE